ncbi:MAG TPA: hypothetical protein DCZ91_02755 [Lachnospiraceae bacterium]|nr:hypothetical protein [Lachnospiraceae bacterium]
MAVEKEISKEVKDNVIDMLITLVVEELSEELKTDPDEMLIKFVTSKTGELLYDEESRLWWNGPSYIADLYKNESEQI